MTTSSIIKEAIKNICNCIKNAFGMFSKKMKICTIMGITTLPNKHSAMLLMWALLLLQVRLKKEEHRYNLFQHRVEEPVSHVRQSSSGGVTNKPPFPKMP